MKPKDIINKFKEETGYALKYNDGKFSYGGSLDLRGTDLRYADLRYADLRDADLCDADLCDTDLCDTDLYDWGKIQSSSDILIIGTIGSRNGYTTIFHTDKGIFVQCGCFMGTLDEFEAKVKDTHQDTKHERDYLAMIEFVKIKFSEYENRN